MATRSAEHETLLDWFVLFLEFTERRRNRGEATVDAVLDFGPCWEFWWWANLDSNQQREIRRCVAALNNAGLEQFLVDLGELLRRRSGSRAAAATLLRHLPSVPLFAPWAAAVRAHAGAPRLVNLPVIQQNDGSGVVIPLSVFLRPRKPGDTPIQRSASITPDGAALAALPAARDAVLKLLKGSGLVRVALLGLFRLPAPGRGLAPVAAALGWLGLATGLASVILFGPALPSQAVRSVLAGACLLALLLIPWPLWRSYRELALARRLARALLEQQTCITTAAGNQDPLVVRGGSWGLAVSVATLAALVEEAQACGQSWLWRRFGEWARAGAHRRWAFTGEVCVAGQINKVQDLAGKLDACRRHADVTDVAMPVQKSELQSIPQGPPSPAPTTGVGALRLHPFRHLATLVLHLSGGGSYLTAATSFLALVSLATLGLASRDAARILFPPAAPRLMLGECKELVLPGGERRLWLAIETATPDAFELRAAARSLSEFRAPFRRAEGSVFEASAELLVGHAEDTLAGGNPPGDLQIVRPQSFLGRELKDVVVLQANYAALLRDMAELQPHDILLTAYPPCHQVSNTQATNWIAGKVTGITRANYRNYQILLYSFAGDAFWVQPRADSPFTALKETGSFDQRIHDGLAYVVCLVRAEFTNPPLQTADPPQPDGRQILKMICVGGAPPH